ncbi:ABC transporter ATP-binding protein [Humitalea sp. 24SJ18S-53]|uniref:ABC transporter ATP-binding protein n=1 Tax=Humitalea sp. 24SJ18S-53 TaxID=3422307 RepID=UPI003D67E1D8
MGISVIGLNKRYGPVTAIGGVSFDIADGEFVSLLGPSGCGKTTTLRCIAGLEDATGGRISIGGRLVSAPEEGLLVPAHERQIGMVFQSYAVWPHMTVQQNVAFPLSVRGVPTAAATAQVMEALTTVGLGHLAERHPSQLSGGQQQRVALARAIVGKPSVLLFDEPLSNLDAKLREGMRGEIHRLQRRLGIAAVYVTHDREEALSMSDRVIVMEQGRIVQMGTPRDLYRRPNSRFVADFVGKVGLFPLRREAGGWSSEDGTRVVVGDGVAAGTTAIGAVRPENIRLYRRGETGPEANMLAGVVADAQYLGPFTEYVVDVAGASLRAFAQMDLSPGAEVTLGIDPDNLVLLPATEAHA